MQFIVEDGPVTAPPTGGPSGGAPMGPPPMPMGGGAPPMGDPTGGVSKSKEYKTSNVWDILSKLVVGKSVETPKEEEEEKPVPQQPQTPPQTQVGQPIPQAVPQQPGVGGLPPAIPTI